MTTVFFSWQSDISSNVCRNIIERSLQSAIDRLQVDFEIGEAVRENIELDRDTKNVPGSPAIFDTIKQKIAAAHVFVADLTFVGQRLNGRPMANPNVLIEYGLALAAPGWSRLISVMNVAYGDPSGQNMPFNLAHTRFPITYNLAEGSSEEDRKNVKKDLTKRFEGALRSIFESSEYKTQTVRPPTALEIAALHRDELDLETEEKSLTFGTGPGRVLENAAKLVEELQTRTDAVIDEFDLGMFCGARVQREDRLAFCSLRTEDYGLVMRWAQPQLGSLNDAALSVQEFQGRIYLPGEDLPSVFLQQPRTYLINTSAGSKTTLDGASQESSRRDVHIARPHGESSAARQKASRFSSVADTA
jgi:hypothetical protein